MPWERRQHLRFADIDYLGHVTAAAYLLLFEETRAAWMRETFGVALPVYVVARQEIDYLREVLLDDSPLTLTIEPVRVGRSSLDIAETLVTASGEAKARSRGTLVMWHLEERHSRPFTEDESAALRRQVRVPTPGVSDDTAT
jgi:acyl-CoA thioester hydrolase